MFKVLEACACCGAELGGAAQRQMVGQKEVCSNSCRMNHFRNYQIARNEALDKVNREFYG